MSAEHLLAALTAALALPDSSRVDQRVPKKMLVEHGAPTAADKRLLNDGLEDIQWLAALKPSTVAVPEYRDAQREYLEVAVLSAKVRDTHVRPAQLQRLTELIHRAIPYPVWLMLASGQTIHVSLVHKRAALNNAKTKDATKLVLEEELFNLPLTEEVPTLQDLLASLALHRQAGQHLHALYQSWIDCLIAAQAARITGHFALPDAPEQAAARHQALRACQALEEEASRLTTLANKEKQIARLVELNLALQQVQSALNDARAQL
ncbi:MAG: DUF4391 domain-containing protein [Rhodocyclaceae bacterium]